jgi:hypothetical protein
MLPNFLIIGATKCGTTSLHDFLSQHPQIFVHPKKELNYFSKHYNTKECLLSYQRQFEEARNAIAIGESSNSYTRHPILPNVPARIAAILPNVRMIYLIRDPMLRMESHYRHRLITGREWREADEAIRSDPKYVVASLYGQQLQAYYHYFRREQFLLIRSEELFGNNAKEHLDKILEFLGVDSNSTILCRELNITAERRIAPHAITSILRGRRSLVATASRRLRRSSIGKFLRTADKVPFALSETLRLNLIRQFKADRALLANLAGHEVAKWHIEEDPVWNPDNRNYA